MGLGSFFNNNNNNKKPLRVGLLQELSAWRRRMRRRVRGFGGADAVAVASSVVWAWTARKRAERGLDVLLLRRGDGGSSVGWVAEEEEERSREEGEMEMAHLQQQGILIHPLIALASIACFWRRTSCSQLSAAPVYIARKPVTFSLFIKSRLKSNLNAQPGGSGTCENKGMGMEMRGSDHTSIIPVSLSTFAFLTAATMHPIQSNQHPTHHRLLSYEV